MAPDERDRTFDQALARHLRSAAHPGDAPSLPEVSSLQIGACPDSETLAAYHERSLFPDQLNSLKEHIVGCANCQTILAQLEATDDISLPASAAKQVMAKESAAASPRKSRRVLLLRGARWQWLAPAGALAAGLLVWIAWHENQPLVLPSWQQVRVATNQAPPAPAAPPSRQAEEVSPVAKAASKKPSSSADELAANGANPLAAQDALKSSGKQEYLAQVSPAKPRADQDSRLRKDTTRRSSVEALREDEKLDRDARTAGVGGQQTAELQLPTQATNAQVQNQANANSPALPGPAPLGQTETKKMKTVAAAPAPPAPAPPAANGDAVSTDITSAALEVSSGFSNPRLISAPGSRHLWRAGRSGLIEFSKDVGSSWLRQTSGVLVDLLAGSAPSDQVCWIVGRAGAIVLTTDGGAQWKLIKSPLSEDLGGVRASDALHATIWNPRVSKTYQTTDGGQTWTPVPSP